MKKTEFILLSACLALLSCRPTIILQEGNTKYFTGKELKKVAVMSMPGELLDVRAFENTMTTQLRSRDKEVLAVHRVFNEDSIPADGNALWKELKKRGFDGIVEIRFVSSRVEESNSTDDQLTNREYRIMDVSNYGKLVQEYGKREEQGAVFKDVRVKMDVKLYDYSGEEAQVIWSARTETSNPKNARTVANGVASKTGPKVRKTAFPEAKDK